MTRFTSAGAGTRADYRYSDSFSATMDLTASFLGSPTVMGTAEVGTRFSPVSWAEQLRPFFDVRAAYMHMFDEFPIPEPSAALGGLEQQLDGGRYSRGFGGVTGAGLEFSLTRTIAFTTELSGMRSRMTMYRMSPAVNIPNGTTYWMTSFRYTFGLKYNPGRTLHLSQNPRS